MENQVSHHKILVLVTHTHNSRDNTQSPCKRNEMFATARPPVLIMQVAHTEVTPLQHDQPIALCSRKDLKRLSENGVRVGLVRISLPDIA